jgi:hypothetical protein
MDTSGTKKRNTTLIVVGIVLGVCLILVIGAVVLFGALGRLASKMISIDPAEAAAAAHEICDYDLPAGYGEQMSMGFPGYKFVVIASSANTLSPTIMLAQFAADSNMTPEQMQEQLSQAYDSGASPGAQMQVVETKTMTIRGYETQVVISEGSVQGGITMRQLLTVFPGKSGQAMLMIQGAASYWDEQLVDDFIRSIR